MNESALPADIAKAVVGLSGLKAMTDLEIEIDEAVGIMRGPQTELDHGVTAASQAMIESWDLDKEVEPWNSIPTADLRLSLGPLKKHVLPNGKRHETLLGMSACRDPLGLATSWGRADKKPWWTDPSIPDRRKVPLTLSHHQLVGVRKCLHWLAHGQSGLIADEVGVGKTAQIMTLINFREQLLYIQKRELPFPPALGESAFFFIRVSVPTTLIYSEWWDENP